MHHDHSEEKKLCQIRLWQRSQICASEKWIFWLKSQQWYFEPKTSIPAGYSLFDWEMMKFDNSSISILFQILLFNMNSVIYLSMGDDSNWTTMLSLRDSSESLFLISVFNFFIKLKPLSHSVDEDGLVNTKSITDKIIEDVAILISLLLV